jgi:hypothetical protein
MGDGAMGRWGDGEKLIFPLLYIIQTMTRRGMACIAVVVAIALVALAFFLSMPVKERGLTDDEIMDRVKSIEAPKAPQELLDYYWKVRLRNLDDIVASILPDTPLFGDNFLIRYAQYAEELIDHDIGKRGEYSEMALTYLYDDVLVPIAKAVDVDPASQDLEDRLTLAKAIYYWVRDGIKFTSYGDISKVLKAIPLTPLGLLYPFDSRISLNLSRLAEREIEVADAIPIPFLMKTPVETASYGHATCQGQTLLLAALLKLTGFDVSIGFISLQILYSTHPGLIRLLDLILPVKVADIFNIPGLGHMYVMLKDPGWSVGRWEVGEEFQIVEEGGRIVEGYMPPSDIRGRDIDGKWILLDPTYSDSNTNFEKLPFDGNFPTWIGPNPNVMKFSVLD